MPVERLIIQDFRGFEKFEITFEHDLTVIVGANGSGKTTVVDALMLAHQLGAIAAHDVRVGADQAVTDVFGRDGDQSYRMSIRHTREGVRHGSGGQGTRPVLYYPANRHVVDETPGSTKPRTWGPSLARMTRTDGVDYEQFFAWLREMEDVENEQIRYEGGKENPQLAGVRRAVSRLLPGYENLRVHRQGAMGVNLPRLAVEKKGTLLLFDALSEGERTLIAMIADIARRLAFFFPDNEDPLAHEFILVVDEVDQHLHPGWQRVLPTRLREVFPGAQLILTTQSPIIVSEVEDRCLRVLKDFALVETGHRKGQDANEVLEATFETAARPKEEQALLDRAHDELDDGKLDDARGTIEDLERRLGPQDGDVVFLRTMLERLEEARESAS